MVTIKIRRIDRLVLLRVYKKQAELSEFTETLSVANEHVDNKYLKKIKNKNSTVYYLRYQGNNSPTGVSFRFFSVQKYSAISIECNPSKLAEDDWADFQSFMSTMFHDGPKEACKTFKVSSLEVACDVKVPLDDLVILAPRISIINQYYLDKGTLYLGHEYGRRSFCIYDKRKQLAEKKGIFLDHDLTRIEVTLRQMGQKLGDLDIGEKPFGGLVVLRKSLLLNGAGKFPDIAEVQAFVKAIQEGCVGQQVYLAMSPHSRRRLLKSLRPYALKLNSGQHGLGEWFLGQKQAILSKFNVSH